MKHYIIEHHRAEIRQNTRQNYMHEFPCGFDIIKAGVTLDIASDTWVSDLEAFEDIGEARRYLSENYASSVQILADGRTAIVEEYVLVEEDEDEERIYIDVSEMSIDAWVSTAAGIDEQTFSSYSDAKRWVETFGDITAWNIG